MENRPKNPAAGFPNLLLSMCVVLGYVAARTCSSAHQRFGGLSGDVALEQLSSLCVRGESGLVRLNDWGALQSKVRTPEG